MTSASPIAAPGTEKTLLRTILRQFGSRPDLRLFRNNVGVCRFPDGSRVVYGLCPGSSDLIEFQTIRIAPEMVGHRLARFVAIEVKGPSGRATDVQRNFLRVVSEAGGIAILARSPMDVKEALEG
jgi:hypothetical protein